MPGDMSDPARKNGGSRRLDIQGLRAVAVLLVVAFHAGLPVPGGFVGVDVFFVISGFVIAGMLRREWSATGRLDLATFYVRRFKRLTPALALMVGVTTGASALFLSPLGPQQTAVKTAVGAMLLNANRVIADTTGGYFDAPAANNPLLNTWTLSVEEQFYLVFPALLVLGWLLARRHRRLRLGAALVVGLVAAGSFVLADLSSITWTTWPLGFYSPITRAWEFAAGALLGLASGRVAARRRGAALALGLSGAGLLVASGWLIDDGTPYPGAWTLLPVGGALALILAGTSAPNIVTRVLETRQLVTVGDWSYSIYLWHWPFIVFASILWPTSSSAPKLAAALSLAPALASYRWVEQPIRTLPSLAGRRLGGVATVVLVSPLLVAGVVWSLATDYWQPRYESGSIPIVHVGDIGETTWHSYVNRTFLPCTPQTIRAHALRWQGILRCQQSQPGRPSIALIGDSHAEHLFPGLAEQLRRANVAYYIVGNGSGLVTADPDVARIVRYVTTASNIRTVVVSADWQIRGVDRSDLSGILESLKAAGKAVFVLDDVPTFPFDPFGCKYRRGLLQPTNCSMDVRDFDRERARYYPQLRATVREVSGVGLLNTARYFCDRRRCEMAHGRQLLFRDPNHLNLNGSRFLARRLLRDDRGFAAAVGARAS
jgi:peptidoglycan/LPS O-acetylase OafA/YrhL